VWVLCLIAYGESEFAKNLAEKVFWVNPSEQSTFYQFFFYAYISFFAGITETAGHELLHKKNPWHKFFGNLPY
jgi:hypothetical protein